MSWREETLVKFVYLLLSCLLYFVILVLVFPFTTPVHRTWHALFLNHVRITKYIVSAFFILLSSLFCAHLLLLLHVCKTMFSYLDLIPNRLYASITEFMHKCICWIESVCVKNSPKSKQDSMIPTKKRTARLPMLSDNRLFLAFTLKRSEMYICSVDNS